MSAEAYSQPSQASGMQPFGKIVNSFWSLAIFSKSFALDVWLSSEYASGVFLN